jgi:hypothetical protein
MAKKKITRLRRQDRRKRFVSYGEAMRWVRKHKDSVIESGNGRCGRTHLNVVLPSGRPCTLTVMPLAQPQAAPTDD